MHKRFVVQLEDQGFSGKDFISVKKDLTEFK